MKSISRISWLVIMLCGSAFAQPALTLKPNDLWVMAGDSITAQRLHSNYIEAFYRTRYPQLNLRFRNSGISGNRTGSILARFDYDVAAWKPTIVSIELGMNDVNSKGPADPAPDGYLEGMKKLADNIRGIQATPILISSSPVDDGSLTGAWKSDRCRRLDPFTAALVKSAATWDVRCVDQYHALLDFWGKNHDAGIKLGGNPVHPGPVGQYTMAAVILQTLQADPEVSAASLKADGTVVSASRCKITEVSAKDGRLAFTRLDECSPWPIDPKAKAALELMPAIAELSRYMLVVSDLPAGRYAVTINGQPAAVLTEKQLAAGWNISTTFEGALAERSTDIVTLIATLQGKLNNDWRAASKAKNTEKLSAAQKAIDDCEAQVSAACRPVALRFEIQPEK